MVKRKSKAGGWNLLLAVAYLLLVGGLLANLVIIGAVPSLPQAGTALADAISRQSWDLHLYMSIGGWLNSLTGLGPVGVDVLEQALGSVGKRAIEGNVSGALIHFTGHQYSALHGWLQWLRWLPPMALVLVLLLTWLRPRQVHSLGTH